MYESAFGVIHTEISKGIVNTKVWSSPAKAARDGKRLKLMNIQRQKPYAERLKEGGKVYRQLINQKKAA